MVNNCSTVSEPVARIFGEQRAKLRRQNLLIGDIDLLIAATCLHHNLTLLTTNPRHFERVEGLLIVSEPW
jgi:tRNA(fMet)-specific endonuclease VapC